VAWVPRSPSPAPALPATQFLVSAVASAVPSPANHTGGHASVVEDRVVWVLDLFERLERRNRAESGWSESRQAAV
jgi:15-cis-phytoene synthase